MSDQAKETDEPNEFGFAGAATAPQPEPETTHEDFGEEIAVPAGDLTGSIVAAMEPDDTRTENENQD